jgi:hypothetical protein
MQRLSGEAMLPHGYRIPQIDEIRRDQGRTERHRVLGAFASRVSAASDDCGHLRYAQPVPAEQVAESVKLDIP